MKLYLLRHGKAEPREGPGLRDDASRALTPEGRRRVELAARGMRRMGLRFDRILSSPLVRARETAEIVAAVLDAGVEVEFSKWLAEDDRQVELIQEIRSLRPPPENLLLVGHEPWLSELVALLIGGGPMLPIRFKKSGLACLSINALEPGPCGVLEWLLAPRQLRLLGGEDLEP
ncbi:MAG: phosphohistidine phosphatase SixA [Verrucomicrobia bacterium]|nr:MAG: phosphohistidine phosphatase SixA [Verrucomicrobiota bacterium]